ncbi:hypothetical protein BN182_3590010 [Clostridioides difficile E9]|nr:hypothetical protein BN182_3590010 [Clostridioides difficile E9]CCL89681.1 hypothetical protein BN189_4390003 [Clostridioides difficile T10]
MPGCHRGKQGTPAQGTPRHPASGR